MGSHVASEKREKYKQSIDEWKERMVKKGVVGGELKVRLHALDVSIVPVDDLKPNPYNPNRQSDEEFALLLASIEKDGFTMPVLANKDGTIVDGEHRWLAAKKLGYAEIPVVFVDLDDVRMRIATIRHNKARGEHDADLEAMVIADLERLAGRDFIAENLLIPDEEIDKILSFQSAFDAAGDEFRDAWVPARRSEVFSVDDEGKPKAPSSFQAWESIDGALVVRSATQDANMSAFRIAAERKSGGKKPARSERPRMFACTMPIEVAEQVVAFYESDIVEGGTTPAERFYLLSKRYLEEEAKDD